MKLRCHLNEILAQLGYSDREFASEVNVGVRQVAKLRQNRGWRLDSDAMERIYRFLFDHAQEPLFSLTMHPIWHTFERSSAVVYRASRGSDATVEEELRNKFLEKLRCPTEPVMIDPSRTPARKKIERMIAERNCIFVGSPKFNPATEVALSVLYGATPFDSRKVNRARIPVQVIGTTPYAPDDASAILVPSQRQHGFQIATAGGQSHFVKVTRLNDDAFVKYRGAGHDAAVVVVRRSGDHTTIVMIGYTGRATLEIARQLTHGDPPLSEQQLSDGKPHLFAYQFGFTKTKRAVLGGPETRVVTPGSGVWAPPWSDITS